MALIPLTVFGGYRMADEVWQRTLDGHECDYDYEGLPETLYPTREACEQAIKELT